MFKSPFLKRFLSIRNSILDWMYGGHERHPAKPVTHEDLRKFLDPQGRLQHPNELRHAIYEGGVELSSRKVIWRHLLNIFPTNMTSLERVEYLKEVSNTYTRYENLYFEIFNNIFFRFLSIRLKSRWKDVKTM